MRGFGSLCFPNPPYHPLPRRPHMERMGSATSSLRFGVERSEIGRNFADRSSADMWANGCAPDQRVFAHRGFGSLSLDGTLRRDTGFRADPVFIGRKSAAYSAMARPYDGGLRFAYPPYV